MEKPDQTPPQPQNPLEAIYAEANRREALIQATAQGLARSNALANADAVANIVTRANQLEAELDKLRGELERATVELESYKAKLEELEARGIVINDEIEFDVEREMDSVRKAFSAEDAEDETAAELQAKLEADADAAEIRRHR